MAVDSTDGFLLSEVHLSRSMLNLAEMMGMPLNLFNLEMIAMIL